MARRIEQSHNAREDTMACYLYIARERPSAAERFLDALEAALARVAEMPGIGAPVQGTGARLAALRRWPVPGFRSYLIFYREREDRIEVVRVLHGARDIDRILLEEAEESDAGL